MLGTSFLSLAITLETLVSYIKKRWTVEEKSNCLLMCRDFLSLERTFSAVFIIIMSCLLCFETNSPRPKAREAKQPIPWGDVSAPPSLCVLPSRSPELCMLQEEQENAWWGRQAKEGQMAPYKWPVTAWINTRQEPPRNRVQAYL